MRLSVATAFVLLLIGIDAAEGAVITGLFNTGVNGSGAPLADMAIDPHYSIIVQPSAGSQSAIAIPADGFPIGQAWIPNDADSRWIAVNTDADGNGPPGIYVYRTTFTLPTNVDLATVAIHGSWSTDNEGIGISINGFSTGNSLPSQTPFFALTNFTVSGHFATGLNTLDFTVQNDGGPTGLRVDNISGTFNTVAAAPEPASLCLWVLGALGSASFACRKRSALVTKPE